MLKKSQHGFSAHLLLPVVAIVTVLGSGGYLAKHYYDIGQQRKEFMTAKAEVTTLGETIATKTKPAESRPHQFCDYGHGKFEAVGRTCWAKYYLYFRDTSEQTAIELSKVARGVLEENVQNLVTKQDGTVKTLSSLRSASFDVDKFGGYCSIATYYNDSSSPAHFDKTTLPGIPFDTKPNSAIMVLTCSGDAMTEYFPVRKP